MTNSAPDTAVSVRIFLIVVVLSSVVRHNYNLYGGLVISYTVEVVDLRVAAAIHLSSEARAELHRLVRRRTTPVRVVERCRIVLLAAEGLQDKQIAEIVAKTTQTTPVNATQWSRSTIAREAGISESSVYRLATAPVFRWNFAAGTRLIGDEDLAIALTELRGTLYPGHSPRAPSNSRSWQ